MTRKALLILAALALWLLPGAAQAAEVHTLKKVYHPGEPIEVAFSGAPGTWRDWITVVPVGTPDNQAGDYDYTGAGVKKGVVRLPPQPPGHYEARGYFNYRKLGYRVGARYRFQVAARSASKPAKAAHHAANPQPEPKSPPPKQAFSRDLNPRLATEAQADPRQALLYIYRERQAGTQQFFLYLSLDGQSLTALPNAAYFTQSVAPGSHTLSVGQGFVQDSSALEDKDVFLIVQPGRVEHDFAAAQVYYLRLKVTKEARDRVDLDLVSPATGARDLKKHKLNQIP
ncbi:MAG: DUF2846 domain-containing protein [Deltaproteobacteria bacterium]|nr:DUF2846 domain-containing protein [Deltaproteobacteria bacterium]